MVAAGVVSVSGKRTNSSTDFSATGRLDDVLGGHSKIGVLLIKNFYNIFYSPNDSKVTMIGPENTGDWPKGMSMLPFKK